MKNNKLFLEKYSGFCKKISKKRFSVLTIVITFVVAFVVASGIYILILNGIWGTRFIEVINKSKDPKAYIVDFTGSPVIGKAPLTVKFTGISSNGPTSWVWDFGDGTSSTVQNPSHTYNTFGIYDVKLTVIYTHGSIQKLKSGYINVRKDGNDQKSMERVYCAQAGGDWILFRDSCVDSCAPKRFCSQVITEGCSCPNGCWNSIEHVCVNN